MAIRKAAVAAAISLFFSRLPADTAFHVIDVTAQQSQPAFQEATLYLDNIEPDGTVTRQVLRQYGKFDGKASTAIDLRKDATEKGLRLLRVEKPNGKDDIWISEPNSKSAKRIAGMERYKPFAGTEFSYNDLLMSGPEDGTNEMLAEKEWVFEDSQEPPFAYRCWVILSTPSAKSNAGYDHRILWIDRESHLPVRIKCFDKKGNLLKTFAIEKVERVTTDEGKTYYLRKQFVATNNETGRATRITMASGTVDREVDASVFTQHWLTTGK